MKKIISGSMRIRGHEGQAVRTIIGTSVSEARVTMNTVSYVTSCRVNSVADEPPNLFRKGVGPWRGDGKEDPYFYVRYEGGILAMIPPRGIGLDYIRHLLAHPGETFSPKELCATYEKTHPGAIKKPVTKEQAESARQDREQDGISETQPVMTENSIAESLRDPEVRRELNERLGALREAQERGDDECVKKINRMFRDDGIGYTRQGDFFSRGFRIRDRNDPQKTRVIVADTESEKARDRVRKAIQDAFQYLSEATKDHSPELIVHLRATIKTARFRWRYTGTIRWKT